MGNFGNPVKGPGGYTPGMPLPRKSAREAFVRDVREAYRARGRHDLPWRKTRDPYRILVSEVMLQQTQVERVRGHYARFLERFPGVADLAAAPASSVIAAWQGLGYNRRALALHRAAREILARHGGKVPRAYADLVALPGVGPYTAAAVRAFAWNEPGVLLETNVRAAYIERFFPEAERVGDRELAPIVEATADAEDPRTWYWALMDYGAEAKALRGNATRRSAGYAKQKRFEGSDRQLRGRVLRLLAEGPRTRAQLRAALPDGRLDRILEALTREGFLAYTGRRYALAD